MYPNLRSNPALPSPLTLDQLIEEQKIDEFCQNVLARQLLRNWTPSSLRTVDGLLKQKHPYDPDTIQIVVLKTLRSRLLTLAHVLVLAGHHGQNRMYYVLRWTYFWPHMAVDVAVTVRHCGPCARNLFKMRRSLNLMKPATRPLESIAIDNLGPLPKTKRGKRFLLLMTDRFSKLTQVVRLRTTTAYVMAVAFCESWGFKYGTSVTLLSDNGLQFTAKFFQSVC